MIDVLEDSMILQSPFLVEIMISNQAVTLPVKVLQSFLPIFSFHQDMQESSNQGQQEIY